MVENRSKNQLMVIVFLLLLLATVPMAVFVALRNQDIRNRAAGSNEVALTFNPSTGNKARGESFPLQVRLNKNPSNSSTREINVSGAQVQVAISDKFTIGSANCLSPFDGLASIRTTGQTVNIICAIAVSATPVTVTPLGSAFAQVNLTVKSDAAYGSAPITFNSTRVTEAGVAGDAPDVSTAGQNADLTVSNNTPTTTPTVTPTVTPDVAKQCNQFCEQDSDCASSYCYQPPFTCPPGQNCTQVMPQKICRNRSCPENSVCDCGNTSPTVTPTPSCSSEGGPCGTGTLNNSLGTCCSGLSCVQSQDPDQGGTCKYPETSITPGQCNQFCEQDSDCASSYCYQPPLTCPIGQNCPHVMPQKFCRNISCPDDDQCNCRTPSPTPFPQSCETKQNGDANCDGVYDDFDFKVWHCEVINRGKCSTFQSFHAADFNGDNRVDLIDYEIFRRTFILQPTGYPQCSPRPCPAIGIPEDFCIGGTIIYPTPSVPCDCPPQPLCWRNE